MVAFEHARFVSGGYQFEPPHLFYPGRTGVYLFFAISGFVIALQGDGQTQRPLPGPARHFTDRSGHQRADRPAESVETPNGSRGTRLQRTRLDQLGRGADVIKRVGNLLF
jgi:hypothetical protein